MNVFRDGTDESGALTVALVDFVEGSGAKMAALMDRSGGVLAESGFGGPGSASDLAALAAGIHAAGRRMSEITGSGGVKEMLALGGAGKLLLREMASPERAVLLLSVFDVATDPPRVLPAITALEGAIARGVPVPGSDAQLESSITERLDQAFPAE